MGGRAPGAPPPRSANASFDICTLDPCKIQNNRYYLDEEGFCIYLPVTGSSYIPTHGAKYLDTKSYCSPLSSTHPFSFEPFSVRMKPLILPVRSAKTNLSTAGLCASSSALCKQFLNFIEESWDRH